MKKYDKYDKYELIEFYALVEGRVIRLMGGITQADAYLTDHDAFTALWDFTTQKYKDGWGYEVVAEVWHNLFVLSKKSDAVRPTQLTCYKSPPSKQSRAKAKWRRLPVLA